MKTEEKKLDVSMMLARRWIEVLTGKSSGAPAVGVECRNQGWGSLQVGRDLQGDPFKFGDQQFSHGLGSHADSEIALRTMEPIQRIQAVAGVSENAATRSAGGAAVRVVFSVEVDGRELWRSVEANVETGGLSVDLEVPGGMREAVLKAIAVDGNMHCAHATWAGLNVITQGQSVAVGTPGNESLPVPLPGPFSFIYGNANSRELLGSWQRQVTEVQGGTGLPASEITWTDPSSGLECRLALKAYDDSPALEWVVYFKNTGNRDTEILEQIQAVDVTWPSNVRPSHGVLNPARLWRGRGSPNTLQDFEYLEEELHPGTRHEMVAGSGRSSDQWLPFFNVHTGSLGILTAIGWTGQWACTIENDARSGLHMRAGIERTHLRLHPGEEIRGPRILQLFWTGDRIDAHNQWRRLLMEHYVPRIDGNPVTGPLTIMHWGGMTTEEHLKRIALYVEQRLPHEYYWIDAGWYGLDSSFSPDEHAGDWSRHTGDWRVNPRPHPNGLKPIANAAADAGMKFLLWMEPERAIKGTLWTTEHPEWFFEAELQPETLILNLGDPIARRGVTDFVIGLICENNVSLYRQDFNRDPLAYWRNNDAEDRQGISEIRYITGLYAFWDELLETFPGLIIDNCASGGRRIDLETISRSIPLWRSDWQCRAENDPVGGQTHGMGLSYWVPLHGTGNYNSMPTRELCDTYKARSTMGPAWAFSTFPYESHPIDATYPWDWFRRMAANYLRARPAFVGDYYPLTEAKADPRQWAAYQMDRPDLREGFLIAFRRKEAPWPAADFKLRGIDPEATYEIEDADSGKKGSLRGDELLNTGLPIMLPHPNMSALIFYRAKANG